MVKRKQRMSEGKISLGWEKTKLTECESENESVWVEVDSNLRGNGLLYNKRIWSLKYNRWRNITIAKNDHWGVGKC